ncbi:MAG: TetR/AcrR family transcriptional regulator [Proteobacteria bacterium]|nr:TetR/AcrR family transcriptional regulator [Pseudomonadota bacterium]
MKPVKSTRAPAHDTRSRLLEIAEQMMSARGYEGVSIKDVASAAGVQTAAVFYHFPSKAALTAAALDSASGCLAGQIDALGVEEKDARARIENIVRNFGKLKQSGGTFCFGGVFAASLSGLPEEVIAAMHRFSEAFLAALTEALAALHPSRERAENRRKAEALLSAMVGALLLSRMHGEDEAYYRTMDGLLPSLIA